MSCLIILILQLTSADAENVLRLEFCLVLQQL